MKGFVRRLQRLETRARAASFQFSMTIQFIASDNRVTGTLQIESGKQDVWTKLEENCEPATSQAKSQFNRAMIL